MTTRSTQAAYAADGSTRLYEKSATELSALIAGGHTSCVEIMQSFYNRIADVNPKVNAICTLRPREQALAMAANADKARGSSSGPLHGIPIACKDLVETAGLRTSYGSPVYKDNIPATDSLLARRLRNAGALIIGKTNTPEFGAGSNTFNPLFGATCNPYDVTKTAGGSSGGAAAAIATRMLPFADGSDMGGSLRNPAAFCNVIGFRPSMGRVPASASCSRPDSRMGIEGPMARNIDDIALLLSAIAGPDAADPLSLPEHGRHFAQISPRDFNGTRLAWSADLGTLPVAGEVREVCALSLRAFETLGCRLDKQHPDLSDAMDVFRTLRAASFAERCGPLLKTQRQNMKQTLIENTEIGLRLSAAEIDAALGRRRRIIRRTERFFDNYDFLVLPATQVTPFDHKLEWVREIEGETMRDYLEWMSICCIITVCNLPAISMPCGFTHDGLPLGLQIVGKPRADLSVLQFAKAFENATRFAQQAPVGI